MSDVLHFNISDIGVYNAVPWFSTNLLSYIFGYCIDRSIVAKRISITNARKLAVFLCNFVVVDIQCKGSILIDFALLRSFVLIFFPASIFPAIFILAATYAECNHLLVVIFFTLSIGLNAFMPSGLLANPIDLSPTYAGTIMSIGNAAGALCGIIAPFTVGLLTPNVSAGAWACGELLKRLSIRVEFWFYIYFVLLFSFLYPEGVFIRMAFGVLDHIHRPFNQNCDILNVRLR